jgi:hypothetical protein
MNLIKKLNYSTKWNAFESVFYKAILATHQACLFYVASKFIYGLTSIIFALMYLTIELINLGLDRSLAQLSQTYLGNKSIFYKYLLPQLIIQGLLLVLVLLMLINNYEIAGFCFSRQFKCTFLTQPQWLLISFIIICEAMRKTLRIVSQLLFLNKPAAILEMCLITIYVSTFWASILIGYQVGVYTIYIPLLLQSLVGVCGLIYLIYPTLFKIKEDNDDTTTITWKKVLQYRISNYAYQLSDMLFSGNFLIYLFGTMVGIINIGPIKLANYIAVFLKAIIERTFGLSSLAIFAKTKHLPAEQQKIFQVAQNRLSLFMILVLSGFLFFAFLTTSISINDTAYLAMLFFGFTLTNNFLIVYEQLFIIKNKILILFILNLLSIGIFLLVTQYYSPSVASLIVLLVLLRAITILITKQITKYLLNT